jgi:hypothetical protein
LDESISEAKQQMEAEKKQEVVNRQTPSSNSVAAEAASQRHSCASAGGSGGSVRDAPNGVTGSSGGVVDQGQPVQSSIS